MNGQLGEQPPVELIREIRAKSITGRLQLQHDRVRAVIYFEKGELLYAASNVRPLRLREYLLKAGMAEPALARYEEHGSDLELARALCKDHLLTPAAAKQIQAKQVSDVLRLALSWTEGTWEFDPRSRLDETIDLKVETRPLLLEAGRRTPPKFAASRFPLASEMISPGSAPLDSDNLLPTEVFLLSRLDRPAPLNELIAVSGSSENETLVHLYSLALVGLLQRTKWKSVLGAQPELVESSRVEPAPAVPTAEETAAHEADDVEGFLKQLKNAQTHYDVLGVSKESSPAQMKTKYYELARRYHPDRFRRSEPSLVSRLESAFARITQAYETLRDDNLRANYDAKLKARHKAQQLAEAAAPKTTAPATTPDAKTGSAAHSGLSVAERAERQFKEGLEALELGQRKVAVGLFAAAANAVPKEARYHAYYGRLLAEHEQTRRAAEAELQAAIKLDPQNGEYRVMLAQLYRDLGLMLRARGEAERAVEVDPNNAKARDLLRALKSV
ncbi:MAG: DnaJ domain-containing protein [Acidobacteria bacterium]|nr:DnaJ domain-containing protein [Acidobacteriota bacterium]